MTNGESSPSGRKPLLVINGQVIQGSLSDKEMRKVIPAILEGKEIQKEE